MQTVPPAGDDKVPGLIQALNTINDTIYAAGAPLGSERYFTIRQTAVDAIKAAGGKVGGTASGTVEDATASKAPRLSEEGLDRAARALWETGQHHAWWPPANKGESYDDFKARDPLGAREFAEIVENTVNAALGG